MEKILRELPVLPQTAPRRPALPSFELRVKNEELRIMK
jgi:hypothetical protein